MRRNSFPRVAYLDHCKTGGVRRRRDPDLVFVAVAFRERLRRVHEKVHEDLRHACFVDVDEGGVAVIFHEPRAVADAVERQVHGLV